MAESTLTSSKRKSSVQRIKSNFVDLTDASIAEQLQQVEYNKKKEWNQGDRQTARTDVPMARMVESEEIVEKQRVKLERLMRLKRLSVKDEELARKLQETEITSDTSFLSYPEDVFAEDTNNIYSNNNNSNNINNNRNNINNNSNNNNNNSNNNDSLKDNSNEEEDSYLYEDISSGVRKGEMNYLNMPLNKEDNTNNNNLNNNNSNNNNNNNLNLNDEEAESLGQILEDMERLEEKKKLMQQRLQDQLLASEQQEKAGGVEVSETQEELNEGKLGGKVILLRDFGGFVLDEVDDGEKNQLMCMQDEELAKALQESESLLHQLQSNHQPHQHHHRKFFSQSSSHHVDYTFEHNQQNMRNEQIFRTTSLGAQQAAPLRPLPAIPLQQQPIPATPLQQQPIPATPLQQQPQHPSSFPLPPSPHPVIDNSDTVYAVDEYLCPRKSKGFKFPFGKKKTK